MRQQKDIPHFGRMKLWQAHNRCEKSVTLIIIFSFKCFRKRPTTGTITTFPVQHPVREPLCMQSRQRNNNKQDKQSTTMANSDFNNLIVPTFGNVENMDGKQQNISLFLIIQQASTQQQRMGNYN